MADKAYEFLEEGGFFAPVADREALVEALLGEMQAGLAGRPSSLAMLPSYVSPEGELQRETPVTVIDAGGTNLRGAIVEFPAGGGAPSITHREKGSMPGATEYVAPDGFYETFAAHVRRLSPFAKDPSVGFCFSYPFESSPDGDGKLLHWTKQIRAPEIVGQWVGAELARRLPAPAPRILLMNDTVTTLLAGKALEKPGTSHSAYIGFILGTGTNVAYVERTSEIRKISDAKSATMVVNSESGGFSRLEQSAFDKAMDAKTNDPGCQMLEKMISGAYLGRLGLEILQAAAKKDFFPAEAAARLLAVERLDSAEMDAFCAGCADAGTNPLEAAFSSCAGRETAVRFATEVVSRAAELTAIHLAAFVVKTGEGKNPSAPVCICVDGSTYHKTRTIPFPKAVRKTMEEILAPRGLHFDLVAGPDDSPMVGAAAAVLLRHA